MDTSTTAEKLDEINRQIADCLSSAPGSNGDLHLAVGPAMHQLRWLYQERARLLRSKDND